jgi:PAS domain S-box-containing protein
MRDEEERRVSTSDFLTGGGVMGARIKAHDWSTSPLGPIDTWPQPLRIMLGTLLASKFPGYIAWGPELISFYNDAYLPMLGEKNDALGKPLREVWPEIWDEILPIAERALSGVASYLEDLPYTLLRKSYPEQTWFTFSYSPIRIEDGKVGGVFCIIQETTKRVQTEQRLQFLVDLGNRLRALSDPRDAMAAAAEMLGRHLAASRAGYVEMGATGETMSVDSDWTDGVTPTFAGRYRLEDFGGLIHEELAAGQTVRLDDTLTDPRTSQKEVAEVFIANGKRASLIVPIIKAGVLAATLYIHQTKPRQWRDDEVALVQEVAERTWEAAARMRAEKALKESQERLRQFAEHSATVLWLLDLETGRMEYISPAYETIWGEPVEVALNDPDHWIETLHPDDRVLAAKFLERVQRGEEANLEYHIVRPDGGVRWIRDTFFPIRDEHGRIRRAGGIAQDITQHDGSIVYVVDGSDASRKEICLLLQGVGYEVKVFASAQRFLEVAPMLVPGCVVLNVRTPEAGALTIPRELKARRLSLPVIVIGEAFGNVDFGVQAMKAGAVDFLDTPYAPEQLLDSVASALAAIHKSAESDQIGQRFKAQIAGLSGREREVLDGLLAGGTNKTIARDLDISPRTVEAHRARIMERLGARSLPELVQIAVAAGLQRSASGSGGSPH